MTAHYRSSLNFTWESIQSSHNSLKKLFDLVAGYKESEYATVNDDLMTKFYDAVYSDFNMPKAIAVVWELLKTDINEPEKVRTLLKMDEILGLNIENHVGFEIPKKIMDLSGIVTVKKGGGEKIMDLAKMRWEYRISGIWDKADALRKELFEAGYVVEDQQDSYKVKRKTV